MQRVVVLGDGQLGLMLAEAASRLGIGFDRVSPEHALLYRGTGRVAEALAADWNASEYACITIEREHLPSEGLIENLAAHAGFLNRDAIATLANRQTQKALLDRLGVATAPWCAPQSYEQIDQFRRAQGGALIIKTARGGYDGRGQWRVSQAQDAQLPPLEMMGLLIAERTIPFERELSLVGARGQDGRCVFYPLVENHHHEGMLRFTLAPCAATPALQQRAEAMLSTIMNDCAYVGVMAMELFDTGGELLVNELAPRVHNSGHWSQAGAVIDQFELHLRALCALPLITPRASGANLMLNIIGTAFDPAWIEHPDVHLHWYAKEPRAARKLGHINFHATSRDVLATQLRSARDLFDSAHRNALDLAVRILTREP